MQRAQAEAERRLQAAIDERRALEALRGEVRAAYAGLLDAVARLDVRSACFVALLVGDHCMASRPAHAPSAHQLIAARHRSGCERRAA